MSPEITINGRNIGKGHPTYIIAEMSANHGQDISKAVEIIHAMKDSGADAVKLQTYTPDTMTIDCDKEFFKIGKGTLWEGKNLYQLYGEAYTPWEWQPGLKEVANGLGMDIFSTPFDSTAVDFLEKMDVPAYKIASFELIDLPLIRYAAEKGKPMIMSTGMASLEEIEEAVETVRVAGNDQIALLKCTSAYPAPPEEMNLRTIPDMADKFKVPIGLSDHSLGIEVPITAISLGACIVEKHFCMSREESGPDSAFSLEPDEFQNMVQAIRAAEGLPDTEVEQEKSVLGGVCYGPSGEDRKSVQFRRSLFVVQDVQRGEEFTSDNVRSIRPGDGLPPKEIDTVLGKKAIKDIERGTPLSQELIE